jgi:flagellar protein FlaF
MQNNAVNVYAAMQKDGLSGRALEAQVLTRAANMLKECQNHWGENGQDERLDTAVRFNQKVWTFFQAELADPENPLPKEIRENILNLSIFIDRRLIEVLLNPLPGQLTSIININQNIAAGLMDRPKADTNVSSAPEQGKLKLSA